MKRTFDYSKDIQSGLSNPPTKLILPEFYRGQIEKPKKIVQHKKKCSDNVLIYKIFKFAIIFMFVYITLIQFGEA
tara:strand:- start:1504 stop:1728 length:225 start_codon:yes stop_codon:yes gene_type:complete